MKKKIIIFIVIIALVSLLVYNNSSYYIKKNRSWKSFSDKTIGDFIEFGNDKNDNYYLDWPKVYKNGEHVGYIAFCLYDNLWIYKTKEVGYNGLGLCNYISK